MIRAILYVENRTDVVTYQPRVLAQKPQEPRALENWFDARWKVHSVGGYAATPAMLDTKILQHAQMGTVTASDITVIVLERDETE